MNKIAKILSVVLSVSLVVGVTVAMLVSAFAASTPKFSISVVSETKDSVTLSLNLEDGSITSCGVLVNASDWNSPDKSTGLTVKSIDRTQNYRDFYNAHENDQVPPMISINTATGKAAFISTAAYSTKGAFLTFTFTKTASAKAKIDSSDIVVEFDGVVDGDNKAVTPTLDNQIPAPVAPTTTTTTTKKADDPTTTTTKKADDPTTTTTKKADDPTTTTTKKADDPTTTTTKKADDVTTTTKKADDVTTTTKTAGDDVVTTTPADDTTTAASTTGDVVNPETGDRLTASAAVVALLAISGAAVVALRKKED